MTNNPTSEEPNLSDIQGLIVRGYNMNFVRYFVLSVNDKPTEAKEFIGGLVNDGLITSAKQWEVKPTHCLNIGFTFEGLKALQLKLDGVVKDVCQAFEHENYDSFRKGAIARASEIGDIGNSDPKNWIKGLGLDQEGKYQAHILLLLFAQKQDILDGISGQLRSSFQGHGIIELGHFDGARLLDRDGNPSDMIHFGYQDGISQPRVKGFPAKEGIPCDGQPIIPAHQFVLMDKPDAPYMVPEPLELGKNGSFAAFRVLKQDVVCFEEFLQKQTEVIDPEKLAAKMCGRWRNGVPLDLSPEQDQLEPPISYEEFNSFNYRDNQAGLKNYQADSTGLKCPIGSHIRRTNPRVTPSAQGDRNIRRLIRRGIPYGSVYDPQSADKSEERGLLGLFICAGLESQFEFVMEDWVNKGKFADLGDNVKDPLLGANDSGDRKFDIPISKGESLEIIGLERFIITRGGAYCFLPSITALKYMAKS